METLKNFFIGLMVILLSIIIFVVISLTWPIVIGLGSIMLSFLAAVVFIILLFYFIVLIGFFVRALLRKQG